MDKKIRLSVCRAALLATLSTPLAFAPVSAWERGGEKLSEGDRRSVNMSEDLQLEAGGQTARQRTEQMVGETHLRHPHNESESRAQREGLHQATAYPEYTSSATVTEADLPGATRQNETENDATSKPDLASETEPKDQEAEAP